jgi:hypothetical protein
MRGKNMFAQAEYDHYVAMQQLADDAYEHGTDEEAEKAQMMAERAYQAYAIAAGLVNDNN